MNLMNGRFARDIPPKSQDSWGSWVTHESPMNPMNLEILFGPALLPLSPHHSPSPPFYPSAPHLLSSFPLFFPAPFHFSYLPTRSPFRAGDSNLSNLRISDEGGAQALVVPGARQCNMKVLCDQPSVLFKQCYRRYTFSLHAQCG